ncbi:MAG: class I SAM-dependent methyltransferase [Anaerolineales bacterium]|nr:class I SAM-dependent methyltransferase [Anaerolineales bacterium]
MNEFLIPGLVLILLASVLVWELYICEGAHFGPRFVVWLYDLTARRYDKIKQFDADWEYRFLGEPISIATSQLADVSILDVGAGTARVARTVLQSGYFTGMITCLEPSLPMIREGRKLVPASRTRWISAWSVPLPFADNTFDMVTCLEILEFTPHPVETLRELVRVLRPGGWLITTNRVSREAPFILGKTFSRKRFPQVLLSIGLQDIEVLIWQVDYDLAWAQKPIVDPHFLAG